MKYGTVTTKKWYRYHLKGKLCIEKKVWYIYKRELKANKLKSKIEFRTKSGVKHTQSKT